MSLTSEIETMAPSQDQKTALGSVTSYHVPKPVIAETCEVVAFFGPGVECTGEIWYEGNIQIDGKLEGLIHTQGTLMIGEQAVIQAKIDAGTVICKGKIQGDVMAREKINLLAPGSINGSLKTPQLSVETGGVINGRVSMNN
jgi:cytoskeletal protein CcmA (bactofilin family)